HLRDLDRRTLVAFYFEGRSLQEMSAEFDSPVGTIKRRLHTARNRLRDKLSDLQLVGERLPGSAPLRSRASFRLDRVLFSRPACGAGFLWHRSFTPRSGSSRWSRRSWRWYRARASLAVGPGSAAADWRPSRGR